MSKNLIIIGASGFGREVAWLVERINAISLNWELLGFIDDNEKIQGQIINGYPVIGKTGDVGKYNESYFVCAVGSAKIREKIINKTKRVNPQIKYATLVDPSVLMSEIIEIGEGTIICAGSILTTNIKIGNHVHINLDCTIGHDAILKDYVTLYPSVNISGNVKIGNQVELGTGSKVIQGIKIGEKTLVGAGSTIIRDFQGNGTLVGNPGRVLE